MLNRGKHVIVYHHVHHAVNMAKKGMVEMWGCKQF